MPVDAITLQTQPVNVQPSAPVSPAASVATAAPADTARPVTPVEEGDAYQLNLSEEGKRQLAQSPAPAAAGAPADSGAATDETSEPAAGGAGGGGGGAAGASSGDDVSSLVEAAKQKVRPLVGESGASEVVSSDGTIDYTKLNRLIEEQEAQAQPNTDIVA